ncbi:hypothetical protein P168DRAFT_287646 [Aspergillus campestris IBT 28561]|uniref:Uncharacterized protein n=1 Tax=Aspergillus campestris (strain IBT 28561) TaxID=1392248 RepID=A0A2I1DB94_ASPC2|nr:uncharacterized protein P168DRAFT_287646 [Aspergillus campestris IBT 28561]PKY07148.1 hypothetical protein P168DRAFT_287646 [Aspergillus campestris IBT 28561]
MFRRVYQSSASLSRTRRIPSARQFHRVTADFLSHDSKGKLVTEKVPVIVGGPGEAYVLIYPEVGSALRAAASQPHVSTSAASTQERCKLTFFHDSQYFGFDSSSYPRLYTPQHIPRQTESNVSPATLFLDGKMHEITLDGTEDAHFAHHASATGRNLEQVLDELEDM